MTGAQIVSWWGGGTVWLSFIQKYLTHDVVELSGTPFHLPLDESLNSWFIRATIFIFSFMHNSNLRVGRANTFFASAWKAESLNHQQFRQFQDATLQFSTSPPGPPWKIAQKIADSSSEIAQLIAVNSPIATTEKNHCRAYMQALA